MKRVAVVLMNLGGPTDLKAVRPFLFNLFYDEAILRLPNPWRWLLARLISTLRAPKAKKIYEALGGKSPLLEETQAQAKALETILSKEPGATYKVFVCMRYWIPRADVVSKGVKDFGADAVVLLPLYPQFSTTTTLSSVREFYGALHRAHWHGKIHRVSCFFHLEGFLKSMEQGVRQAYEKITAFGRPRILWTAHGLPEDIIKEGDPYQWHVEHTAQYLEERLKDLDFESVVCYQSRVGPKKWIDPYTDKEIERAGKEKRALIVVPLSFVSEHSETLVELDMEYAELAQDHGVPAYERVMTARCAPPFIGGLRDLVLGAQSSKKHFCALCSEDQVQRCAKHYQTYKQPRP